MEPQIFGRVKAEHREADQRFEKEQLRALRAAQGKIIRGLINGYYSILLNLKCVFRN